jgi:hypothetical protein
MPYPGLHSQTRSSLGYHIGGFQPLALRTPLRKGAVDIVHWLFFIEARWVRLK